MTNSKFTVLFKISFLFLLIVSCYPNGPESRSDYNLIGTAFDPEFNFDNAKTYLLPDTIVSVKDEGARDSIVLTEEQNRIFVKAVRDNMDIFGWDDRTDKDTTADVLVFVTVISSKYSGNIWSEWFYYNGWGNYEPINPDGKYPWFPHYYPFFYEYNVGSLLITMIDVSRFGENPETPPLVWISGLNGLLSTGNKVNTEPIVESIDKFFELSPILNKN